MLAALEHPQLTLRRRKDEGWTLIELLVVVSLIMLLASISLVQYRNSIVSAKEATLRSQLWIMREAIDQFLAVQGEMERVRDEFSTAVHATVTQFGPIGGHAKPVCPAPRYSKPGMSPPCSVTAISDLKTSGNGSVNARLVPPLGYLSFQPWMMSETRASKSRCAPSSASAPPRRPARSSLETATPSS